MIKTKNELKYYLECDKIALRAKTKKPRLFSDEIWRFEILLRFLRAPAGDLYEHPGAFVLSHSVIRREGCEINIRNRQQQRACAVPRGLHRAVTDRSFNLCLLPAAGCVIRKFHRMKLQHEKNRSGKNKNCKCQWPSQMCHLPVVAGRLKSLICQVSVLYQPGIGAQGTLQADGFHELRSGFPVHRNLYGIHTCKLREGVDK